MRCYIVRNLKITNSEGIGVYGANGLSFQLKNVLVSLCKMQGIVAEGNQTKTNGAVGICEDVEIKNCHSDGICVTDGGLIYLIGAKTKIG